MDKVATPILYSVGNIVGTFNDTAGVVLEVDHGNAAVGGMMNYLVARIEDGVIVDRLWYANDELSLLDDGTAVDSPTVSEAP